MTIYSYSSGLILVVRFDFQRGQDQLTLLPSYEAPYVSICCVYLSPKPHKDFYSVFNLSGGFWMFDLSPNSFLMGKYVVSSFGTV